MPEHLSGREIEIAALKPNDRLWFNEFSELDGFEHRISSFLVPDMTTDEYRAWTKRPTLRTEIFPASEQSILPAALGLQVLGQPTELLRSARKDGGLKFPNRSSNSRPDSILTEIQESLGFILRGYRKAKEQEPNDQIQFEAALWYRPVKPILRVRWLPCLPDLIGDSSKPSIWKPVMEYAKPTEQYGGLSIVRSISKPVAYKKDNSLKAKKGVRPIRVTHKNGEWKWA